MTFRFATAAFLSLALLAPVSAYGVPPCVPVRDHNGNWIPCPSATGLPAPVLPADGLVPLPEGAPKLPTTAENTRRIAQTGTVSYYGGVAQIAAGITQVSIAAQAKSSSQQTETTNEQLVTGLTNIAAGTEAVEQARSITSHANTLEQRQFRAASVGSGIGAREWNLLFEKEKAGRTATSLLDRMEEVAKVSADELIDTVNGGENVYDVAAKAKGLDMSGDELAALVATAAEKVGKPTNPELAPGVKVADLMKDLDMFMGGKATVVAEKAPAPAGAEPKASEPVRQPAHAAEAERAPSPRSPVQAEDRLEPASSGEFLASLQADADTSLFTQIRRQYLKRYKTLLSR